MPDTTRARPQPAPPAAATTRSALATPIDRRRALALIGKSVAGVVLLDACGPAATAAPAGWLPTDVDPATLPSDEPIAVRFSGSVGATTVGGSAWIVKEADGSVVAFDPRCTHAKCAYEPTDDRRFACLCHEAFFDLEGNVLAGPPPRPLDRFAVREAAGRLELQVPADFSTPRPKD
ncbi:MAG: Rieske (2Fe-2S) protein [Chloroflexi bacterium]|nr:Rieske (2Fe-2S) protein [Chloroflexota bacterium]